MNLTHFYCSGSSHPPDRPDSSWCSTSGSLLRLVTRKVFFFFFLITSQGVFPSPLSLISDRNLHPVTNINLDINCNSSTLDHFGEDMHAQMLRLDELRRGKGHKDVLLLTLVKIH